MKEFEEPTDPFLTHRHRFKTELDRYLANVNLDFLPPMPKPPSINNHHGNNSSNSKYSSTNSELIERVNQDNMKGNVLNNKKIIDYYKTHDESYDHHLMTKSSEFEA